MSDDLYIRLRHSEDQRESQQELALDGVRIRLRAMYNASAGGWFLDLSSTDRTLIVGSIALVPGVDLLRPFKHLALPQGVLFVEDLQTGAAPDLVTLDVTALLKYRPVA
jgi:hypothetical protein